MKSASRTPLIRKYLQSIRRLWHGSSNQSPFFFTHCLTPTLTIEDFCIQFVLDKYMQ